MHKFAAAANKKENKMKCPVCGAEAGGLRPDGTYFCKACYSVFGDETPTPPVSAPQKSHIDSLLKRYGGATDKPIGRMSASELKKRGYELESSSPAEAFAYFKEGAEKGDADCMYKVGYAFEYGVGVDKDEERAHFWYTEGRRMGNSRCGRVLRERFGEDAADGIADCVSAPDRNIFTEMFLKFLPSVVKINCDFGDTCNYGTGFIIEGGYIATNAHVVTYSADGKRTRAKSCKLTFAPRVKDPRVYSASIVCIDDNQDMAILRCDDNNGFAAKALTVGDSDSLLPGEDVFTIGNGRDYGLAFTKLSVCQSPGPGTRFGDYDQIIQLTGNTQPGNSGGPLFNMRGEVVGIITFHPINKNVIYGAALGDDGKVSMTKQVVETAVDGVRFAVASKTLRRIAGQNNINI